MQTVTNLADLRRGQVVQYRGVISDIVEKDGKVSIKTMPALLTVLDSHEVTASAGNFVTLGEPVSYKGWDNSSEPAHG